MPDFLYNGVGPLPDIYSVYTPELQETHPFAIIIGAGMIRLVLGKELLYETVGGERFIVLKSPRFAGITGTVWDEPWEGGSEYRDRLYAPYTKWTNTNLLNEDGSIHMAATAPVPVTPVKINPALLVQSFFTGQALRRSRK